MSKKYGVSPTVTSVKWRKEYRRYRASRTRLYLLMALVLLFVSLATLCGAFLFKNSFNHYPHEYELNKGDMRAVEVSTWLCQGIVMKKANFYRRMIVLSPAKRYQATSRSMFSDTVFVRRNHYWYRSLYLLKGSTVTMRLSSGHSVRVYWLKSHETLEKWTSEMDTALKQSSRSPTEQYTGTSMDDTFIVKDDDNYYLGLTSVAGDTRYSEIFINLTINRMVYDIRSPIGACNASKGESCHVVLRFNSDDAAVIAVDDITASMSARGVWTTWYCQPRIWVYVAVFGGVILLAIIVLFFLYLCIMSKVNKKFAKRKPSEIPSRTESFNMHAVKLQSITTTRNSSNIIDGDCVDLAPLRLSTVNHLSDEHEFEDREVGEITNNLNDSVTIALVTDDDDDDSDNCRPWQTASSPRWSTFLQSSAGECEECVTDFHESPIDYRDSEDKSHINCDEEETCFGNELMDRLKSLKTPNNRMYDGPEETDIDDAADNDLHGNPELEPFINEPSMETQDVIPYLITEEGQAEVMRRWRETRREQRWQPRLSMVTEV